MKLPDDFSMQIVGDHYSINVTLRTVHDAESVATAIRLATGYLPSHREAVPGDFGLREPPKPTLRQLLAEAGIA